MGLLCCSKCNGSHPCSDRDKGCPKRITLNGRYYRVLSIKDYARRLKAAYRKMNRDKDDAWDDLSRVSLLNPAKAWGYKKATLLPISSTPYCGRMFVERIGKTPNAAQEETRRAVRQIRQ